MAAGGTPEQSGNPAIGYRRKDLPRRGRVQYMKAVLQRVSAAQVDISGETVGKIGRGFLVLLGVAQGDTEEDLDRLLAKILRLRVFEDGNGKMNRSVQDVGGGLLVVSQFTLLANYRHGNRPDFLGARRNGCIGCFWNGRRRRFRYSTGSSVRICRSACAMTDLSPS